MSDNKPIPSTDFVNGIFTCIDNSKRYYNDAKSIERYQSKTILFYYAKEELAKALYIFEYFKQGSNEIPSVKVKEIFGDHRKRQSKYYFWLKKILSPEIKINEDEFVNVGKIDQPTKEKLMYVDWIGGKFESPAYPQIFDKDDHNVEMMLFADNMLSEDSIPVVIDYLEKDEDYINAKRTN
jgi:AbiV family abortive infection protein